ncbi:MAG: hypothetical protein IIA64_07830 [Planctomycetes bacterium]|nr:hypothetical protein [Planctomycetota bacterium]
MSEPTNGQPTGGIIGVVQRAGRNWRCLIGQTDTGVPRITAWEEFDASQAGRIPDWLAKHDVQRVVGVLPASAVVCRTCSLPHTDAIQLQQALQLQAEAHLLGTAPPHRQATAVLDNAPGETSRTGIMLSWPQAAPFELPETGLETTYASDIAALAALLDGSRPDEPLLWLDRSDGSVALAITYAGGVAFRAARELADTEQGWNERVGSVLAETALDAGHTAPFTESLVESLTEHLAGFDPNTAVLIAPHNILQSAQQRVHGAPNEEDWWRTYGITVGALLAGTDQLAPLTQLRRDAPVETPSAAQRLLTAMSNKRIATRIVIACLIILALWPLAAARLRLLALQVRFSDIKEYVDAAQKNETQLEMYRALRQHAWPMTKLLSDIACNTPRGIDLQLIDLKHEGDMFSVSGTTKAYEGRSPQEVVAQMQQNLRAGGIFTEIYYSWGDRNNFGAYEFTLSGKVAQPYRTHEYPVSLDFGKWTLRDRLYNGNTPPAQAQSTTDTSAPAEAAAGEALAAKDDPEIKPTLKLEDGNEKPDELASAANGRRPSSARPRPVPRPGSSRSFVPGSAPLSRGNDRSPGGGVPASQNIPEPLSEAQINAMTLPEVTESIGLIARALERSHPDDATKVRLKNEWNLLWDRKRAGK